MEVIDHWTKTAKYTCIPIHHKILFNFKYLYVRKNCACKIVHCTLWIVQAEIEKTCVLFSCFSQVWWKMSGQIYIISKYTEVQKQLSLYTLAKVSSYIYAKKYFKNKNTFYLCLASLRELIFNCIAVFREVKNKKNYKWAVNFNFLGLFNYLFPVSVFTFSLCLFLIDKFLFI